MNRLTWWVTTLTRWLALKMIFEIGSIGSAQPHQFPICQHQIIVTVEAGFEWVDFRDINRSWFVYANKDTAIQLFAYGFQSFRVKILLVTDVDAGIGGSRCNLCDVLHVDNYIVPSVVNDNGVRCRLAFWGVNFSCTVFQILVPQCKSRIDND